MSSSARKESSKLAIMYHNERPPAAIVETGDGHNDYVKFVPLSKGEVDFEVPAPSRPPRPLPRTKCFNSLGVLSSVSPLARAPQSGVVLLPGNGFVPSSSMVSGTQSPETAQSLPDQGTVESGTTT